jgi:hypothetical protein
LPRRARRGAAQSLAAEVASYLGTELGKIKIKRFADGEIYVQVGESIRGADVFLVQPTSPPVNDTFMELAVMIDACRRASARSITGGRVDGFWGGGPSAGARLGAGCCWEACRTIRDRRDRPRCTRPRPPLELRARRPPPSPFLPSWAPPPPQP